MLLVMLVLPLTPLERACQRGVAMLLLLLPCSSSR